MEIKIGNKANALGKNIDNYNLMPMVVLIYFRGEIVYANNKSIEFFKIKNINEILGNKIFKGEVIKEKYVWKIKDKLYDLIRTEYDKPIEFRFERANGEVVDIEISAFFHPHNNQDSIIITINDITYKKQYEYMLEETKKRLNESETRYKRLVSLSPNSIFIYTNESIRFANKAAAEFLEVNDYTELLGKNILEVLKPHPDCIDMVIEGMSKLKSPDIVLPFTEQKIIKKDGRVAFVEMGATSIKDKGNISVMIILRDITRRRQTEEELKRSEELYKHLVEFMPDGLFVTKMGDCILSNNNGAKLFGLKGKEDLIGRNVLEFCVPEDLYALKGMMGEFYVKNVELPFTEQRVARVDGKVGYVEIKSAPFNYKGSRAAISVVRDITEKKIIEENIRHLEAALKYDKLKTEFFANLSHELKTPLNIILTAIQLIQSLHNNTMECPQYERTKNYIKMMKQNCYRLLRLINNLIDLTKLDAGYFRMNFVNGNIIQTIEDITLSVVDYTNTKGLTLVFDTDVEEKVTSFDPDKIERVILNLLSNAIKFSKPGGRIEVNIHDKADSIDISVKDYGIGIPWDMIDKIFDRFIRVNDLFTRTTEGSGIGLSLVKSLVEAHGGSIKTISEVGVGSEFIINIPIRFSSDSEEFSTQISSDDKVQKINIEFSDIYS